MNSIIVDMNQFENVIDSVRNILRTEGITGMDSIKHCLAFTISRYLDTEICHKLNIDEKYSFEKLINLKNDETALYGLFFTKNNKNCIVGQIYDVMKFKTDFKLEGTGNLLSIIEKFQSIDIKNISLGYDIVGIIYEIHLKSGTTQAMRDLGQYFTNRQIIEYMVGLCNPVLKPDGQIETILDPSMGTAGFLTMTIKHLNKFNDNIDWSINKRNIIGFDIDENVKNMALLNTFLETGYVFDKTMIKRDTLKDDFILDDKTVIDKVDVILANEPFGIKSLIYAKNCCERIKSLKINGTKAEPLFLQLMMISLKKNGRCAVVVPDGVLFNDANLHTNTRKYLIENLNLKKVVSLNGNFFLNTGVKSSILFFVNDGKTTEVEFYDIVQEVNTLKIIENLICKVSYNDIVKNKYNLFVNKYTVKEEVKVEGLEYKKLDDICTFLPTTKHNSSIGKDIGQYRFYNSSQNDKLYLNTNEINKESIIIGNGGSLCVHYDVNFTASKHVTVAQLIDNDKYDLKYVYYYLLTNRNLLVDKSAGSTIAWLNKTNLGQIEIPLPSLSLQQEIVEALDPIFETIELNNKLIQNYEKAKKAIVRFNTLFCEKKKLGDVVENIKTGKNKPSDNKTGNKYPYYGTGGITGYTDQFLVDGNYILTARNGTIGQTLFVEGKSYPSDHMFIIKDTEENIRYIYYVLRYLTNLENYAVGTTIKGISKESLISTTIPIPSLEVQEHIVKECSHYDNLIDILKKENEKLQNNNIIELALKSNSNVQLESVSNVNSDNDNQDIFEADIQNNVSIEESNIDVNLSNDKSPKNKKVKSKTKKMVNDKTI
jgi:type I restriction-modification system DNA methylase subunit